MSKRKLSEAASKMLFSLSISAAVLIVGGFVWIRAIAALPFAFGVVLIYGTHVMRVFMLDSVTSSVIEAKRSVIRANLMYLLRFAITGAVFAAAALTPYVSLPGVALGAVTWSVSVYSLRFLIKNK